MNVFIFYLAFNKCFANSSFFIFTYGNLECVASLHFITCFNTDVLKQAQLFYFAYPPIWTKPGRIRVIGLTDTRISFTGKWLICNETDKECFEMKQEKKHNLDF